MLGSSYGVCLVDDNSEEEEELVLLDDGVVTELPLVPAVEDVPPETDGRWWFIFG